MKKTTKSLVAGGFAALLSLGIILPSNASAASTNTANTATTVTYKWVYSNSNFNLNELVNKLKAKYGSNSSTTKPAAPSAPAAPTQPAAPSEPAASKEPSASAGEAQGSGSASTNKDTSSQTPSTTQNQTTATTDKSQFATEVIKLVNQERSKAGLKALTGDSALNNMALAKAKDMSQNNYFDHTSPTYGSPFQMMTKFNISYSYAGENIAKGQKTPQDVVTAWMNSEGHRANILNANYTLIGVGYYNGYWAQEFVGR